MTMPITNRTRGREPGVAAFVVALLLIFPAIFVATVPAFSQQQEMGSGTVGGYRWNEFGPEGGKCMDACGPSCPPLNCEEQHLTICHPKKPGLIVNITRYICGSHPACSKHDHCLEQCQHAAGEDYTPVVDFLLGDCQQGCHHEAYDYAYAQTGSHAAAANVARAWILGTEPAAIPWSSRGTWDYSKDNPEGTERTQSCKQCEKCEDGRCVWNKLDCGPCVACGDVHIATLDRLRYDFQAAGEFVLFENPSRSHVVQIRTEPWGDHISVNTAVAMRVTGDTVAIHTRPELHLVINGKPVILEEGENRELPGGGTVIKKPDRFTVVWPDETVVQARIRSTHLDVGAQVADAQAGQMRGLAGDFDGEPYNDIRTREGEQLSRRIEHSVLYGTFGNSWRITQEESLFAYGQGENTETFTILDFPPPRQITLESLDPEAREFAERVCREQDIEDPRLFRDCVFDVGVTGDASFALSHRFSSPPAATVPASYVGEEAPGDITLGAPNSVSAGNQLEVQWSGEARTGDFVAIASPDADIDAHLATRLVRAGLPVSLIAPDAPGRYQIRYIQGEGIAATRDFEVRPVSASLVSPAGARSGQQIKVGWKGPGAARDYIAISKPSASPQIYHQYRYVKQGNPVTLDVPEEPGTYEIRYVQGQSHTVLTRRQIDVSPVSATVGAPSMIPSGSQIEVRWTGPGNRRDYIAIAKPSTPPGSYHQQRYVKQGNPVALDAPEEPGTYEIRYVQGQSYTVLARRPLAVIAVTATLKAPAKIQSGGQIEVHWTGLGNRRDYIAVAKPSAPRGRYHQYRYAKQGNPVTLDAPEEPGTYEIRYVQGQSRAVLARRSIDVTAVTATLDAPQTIQSGGQINVTWSGPGNRRDYISIAEPSKASGEYRQYGYAKQGNPVALDVPEEPGTYEVRYVQGQSRTVLARRSIDVTAVTATLDAPAEVHAGAQIEVRWTGPGNRRDYIAIGDPSDEPGRQHTYNYTKKGNPVPLRSPDEPGTYEIRYVQGQSKTVLARRKVRVVR